MISYLTVDSSGAAILHRYGILLSYYTAIASGGSDNTLTCMRIVTMSGYVLKVSRGLCLGCFSITALRYHDLKNI